MNHSSPKDFFLHLAAIVALYAVAVSFLVVVFQSVNIIIPDQLSSSYAIIHEQNMIRWSLAMLIIIFPLFLGANKLLNKAYKENPIVKELRIRKWLLYFTLFAAAAIIAGDLVTLIFNFLNGELTLRFILKIFAVLLVAGIIGVYYMRDIKNAFKEKEIKIWVYIVSIIMIATIVFGFLLVGSPSEERARRFDEQRVQDLQTIQSQVLSYWINTGTIPQDMKTLEDPLSGFPIPTDPETNEPYFYEVLEKQKFSLCAEFTKESMEENSLVEGPVVPVKYDLITDSNWKHGIGRTCFERTIDENKYPPKEK